MRFLMRFLPALQSANGRKVAMILRSVRVREFRVTAQPLWSDQAAAQQRMLHAKIGRNVAFFLLLGFPLRSPVLRFACKLPAVGFQASSCQERCR